METNNQKHYLELLKKLFPTVQAASTEIINLQAILNLPKGTEHFLSDIHGEYEAFLHVLKNGSGVIRKKIEDVFRTTLSSTQKTDLAQLIYYPKELLQLQDHPADDEWYGMTLHQLVRICREVASKYTRSKVRKALPTDFIYILEELLHEQENVQDKYRYYDEIIKSIVKTGQAEPFIVALCELIQRLAIDHLHVIGDIYDRGPGADIIMDTLLHYHSLDIQWGNHDMGWLGAASGSLICIANTLRVTLKAGNLHTLEEGYGINLLELAQFALDTYPNTHDLFLPANMPENSNAHLVAKMHNAISMIHFKLEGQLVHRCPHFEFEDRNFLHKMDLEKGTVTFDGGTYPLKDTYFPTLDPQNPYLLTFEESELLESLKTAFLRSEKLQRHMDLLLQKGSMYLIFNQNLLYHGCIPMTSEGAFKSFMIDGVSYQGKALIDTFETAVRYAYGHRMNDLDQSTLDIFWYLTTGENSSLFGKKKITTFERYYIEDRQTHYEKKNDYYRLIEEPSACERVLNEFGLDNPNSKIINGHVPVKVRKGESPVKANGRLLVIDGGLSKAYQNVTGIAGYTLIFNSYGMILAAHEPFESKVKALREKKDIISKLTLLDHRMSRILVADTDIGRRLEQDIKDLERLLYAYQTGSIQEDRPSSYRYQVRFGYPTQQRLAPLETL